MHGDSLIELLKDQEASARRPSGEPSMIGMTGEDRKCGSILEPAQPSDAREVNRVCRDIHDAAGRRAERGRIERDHDEGPATCFRDIP